MTTENKQRKFEEDEFKLMDKYDLRMTKMFWFVIGFLLAMGLCSILIIEKWNQ